MFESQKVSELLEETAAFLEGRHVQEAKAKTELMISHILKCRRLEVYLRREEAVPRSSVESLEGFVTRLLEGEPLQYVLGETVFMGHPFKVDRRALIPRPETELLVEAVLKNEGLWHKELPCVADIGTGSGCIAISLTMASPRAKFQAVDISPAALDLARENARALGVEDRIDFIQGDLLEPLDPESLDAIVSNPPYVATSEYARLPREIHDHEPPMALEGGRDGLSVISRLVQQAATRLKSGGILLMEIGENQAAQVRELMEAAGFFNVEILKDLAGQDRIAVCGKP